jgi:membrane fusion protein (multidrug efflux system)
MKKIILGLILIAAVAGGGYYWKTSSDITATGAQAAAPAGKGAGGPPGMSGPTPVITQTIAPQELTQSLSAVGSLIAGESAEIHSESAGQIEEIFFSEGQPVKKGEILLQIDKSLLQTEHAKARAAYDASAATFKRDDGLKQSGFVSNQKWDLSKSEVQTAKAEVENTRIRLEKTSIRAPFDGIAGLRSFSVGDFAQTGQMLTTIDSIDPLKIEFSVPERSYTAVQTGQKISFSVDAFPADSFEGTIYAIDPRIEPQTRNFRVKAEIPNTDGRLRPGMYARVDIATLTKSGVLLVAEEALMPEGTDTYVYVVTDGRAEKRKITLGQRQKGTVEVTEGLSTGDVIITAGITRARPGGAVVPQQTDAATGTAE